MKFHPGKNSQKPGLQRAEAHSVLLTDLLLWNLRANQSEQTLFVRALTCKQHQREDAWHQLATLMESDTEFTNSDKGTQIAFFPKHKGCQRNKCVALVAINLILVLLRFYL